MKGGGTVATWAVVLLYHHVGSHRNEAQGWPDPYRRDAEETESPRKVDTMCSKTRHPPPKSCLAFPKTSNSGAMSVTSVSSLLPARVPSLL